MKLDLVFACFIGLAIGQIMTWAVGMTSGHDCLERIFFQFIAVSLIYWSHWRRGWVQ